MKYVCTDSSGQKHELDLPSGSRYVLAGKTDQKGPWTLTEGFKRKDHDRLMAITSEHGFAYIEYLVLSRA
mgnify:CR=1 FL=1